MGDPTPDDGNDAAPAQAAAGGKKLVHNPAVTGGAAAAGGIFSFALLTEMGMKDQLANAHSTFAFICAITILCL